MWTWFYHNSCCLFSKLCKDKNPALLVYSKSIYKVRKKWPRIRHNTMTIMPWNMNMCVAKKQRTKENSYFKILTAFWTYDRINTLPIVFGFFKVGEDAAALYCSLWISPWFTHCNRGKKSIKQFMESIHFIYELP